MQATRLETAYVSQQVRFHLSEPSATPQIMSGLRHLTQQLTHSFPPFCVIGSNHGWTACTRLPTSPQRADGRHFGTDAGKSIRKTVERDILDARAAPDCGETAMNLKPANWRVLWRQAFPPEPEG